MPKTRTKVSGIRKDKIISPYIQKLLDELIETGDFTSESEIIRTAVINLYKDYEAKGKLKPKREKKVVEDPEQLSPDEEPIFREDVSL